MSNIKIYNYNNYANRIVRREETLQAYGTPVYTENNVNFIPGNEAYTVKIAGTTGYNDGGNYLIECDANNNILSRWFIIDSERTRNGQYSLSLKRDVIAEFKPDVLSSKAWIHKGYTDKSNGLIFNSEGTVVNQIKKSEKLLKDQSDTSWLYIYMKKGAPNKQISVNTTTTNLPDITINTTIENSIYKSTTGKTNFILDIAYVYYNRLNYDIIAADWRDSFYALSGNASSTAGAWQQEFEPTLRLGSLGMPYEEIKAKFDAAYLNHWATISSNIETTVRDNTWIANSVYEELLAANNKVIKDSSGKYYRFSINSSYFDNYYQRFNTGTNAFNTMNTYFTNVNIDKRGTVPDNTSFGCRYNYTSYSTSLELLQDYTETITINPGAKQATIDAQYNVIALPYDGDVYRVYLDEATQTVSALTYYVDKEAQLNLANRICEEYGSDWVLDIQLLPYMPAGIELDGGNQVICETNQSPFTQLTPTNLYEAKYRGEGERYVNIVYFLSTIQNSFDINYTLTYPTTKFPVPVSEGAKKNIALSNNIKLANETEMVRLCSPNYNGVFEFSIAKANRIKKWNIDMTLKPYNPYIHIYPKFIDSVYGEDFNDSRGLICGGDFSLPIINDPWIQYQNQNKNYQMMFDRQIQNMDFNQRQERVQAIVGATVGTLQGAVTGATAGGMATGHPAGAAAGAIAGGLASLGGGIADWNMLIDRQTEQRNYSIDMYNYQLGNIKALPYNLTKISPFNYNNKIFPFIEYYSCTEGEKDAVAEKILMNGYTIDSVGLITNFIKPDYTGKDELTFVQGNLIRIDNPAIDNQLVEEINNELMKGVYF